MARQVGGTSLVGHIDARKGDDLPLHLGAVGIFEGDGTKIVLESQLVSASVADAEPVRFAIEAVFLGLECEACNDCKGEK